MRFNIRIVLIFLFSNSLGNIKSYKFCLMLFFAQKVTSKLFRVSICGLVWETLLSLSPTGATAVSRMLNLCSQRLVKIFGVVPR